MSDTYSTYADICAKFYALTMDARAVAEFVMARSQSGVGERALFVGGMFDVAAGLSSLGLQLTVVDYTEEMVRVGRRRLPQCEVVRADLRELPFRGQFDTVFVVGRVFTHMTTDHDLVAALASCHQALKPSGKLFADNYEDSRILREHSIESADRHECLEMCVRSLPSALQEKVKLHISLVDFERCEMGV